MHDPTELCWQLCDATAHEISTSFRTAATGAEIAKQASTGAVAQARTKQRYQAAQQHKHHITQPQQSPSIQMQQLLMVNSTTNTLIPHLSPLVPLLLLLASPNSYASQARAAQASSTNHTPQA
jgi:hypothetical protein